MSNTHEIAGTAIGRTLVEQGAEAIQTTAPDEYFHEHIFLEAGVGSRQAYVDIKKPEDLEVMVNLVKGADVFAENFRHMGENGLSPQTLAAKRPGLIYVSAKGITHHGAWAGRGAFDPLSLPLTGICALEGTLDAPKYPPHSLLNDVVSGIFGALGAYAALIRRAKEGGSYHVKVSLCRCSMWYGTLGFFERGDTKRDGEQHKLIPPDMFEAETPVFSGVPLLASNSRRPWDTGPTPCCVTAARTSRSGGADGPFVMPANAGIQSRLPRRRLGDNCPRAGSGSPRSRR